MCFVYFLSAKITQKNVKTRKTAIFFVIRSFIGTLTFGLRYFRSKMKRKTCFPFAFCSLIRTFDLSVECTPARKNSNKFGFSLAYSYLCRRKEEKSNEIILR